MEFFRELDSGLDVAELQRRLTIEHLPQYCREIDRVLDVAGDHGEIYCLWGQFKVHRECIKGGVRFTLPGCPNAFAWTVTTDLPPIPGLTVIHCTINRREHEPDFVESIEMFVGALVDGLKS